MVYQQIKIIEDRERKLVRNFSKKYDNKEVEEIVNPIREEYGELKEEAPLSQLIDGNNIHPWLESAIISAQSVRQP